MPTHYGFESEESDEKLVKKEGTLSEKIEDRDKNPEVSPISTTTNEIPSNSSNNLPESNTDASLTNNTDPYKTVEVEMNKLLSGVDNKTS